MYMTRPTAPHLVLNGCPICLQLSNPDSPDGGNPKPGGTWALGGWGELKGWFIGQSGSLSPYLPIHISPSSPVPAPSCCLPIPSPLGSSFAWLSSLWRVEGVLPGCWRWSGKWTEITLGGVAFGFEEEFSPNVGHPLSASPQRRVLGNGKGWKQRTLVKTPQQTQEREEGKEGTRGSERALGVFVLLRSLRRRGASIAQLTNFFPNSLCKIWLLPEGGPF